MEKAKYSPSNNGIYPCSVYKEFPSGAIEIPDDLYKKFQNGEISGFDVIDDVVIEKQPEEIIPDRSMEIISRLKQIDKETLRPLRAVYAGTDTPEDHAKLEELENEAIQLREELNAN